MIYHLYSDQDATIYEKEPTLNAGLDEVLELEKVVTSTSIIVAIIISNVILLLFYIEFKLIGHE